MNICNQNVVPKYGSHKKDLRRNSVMENGEIQLCDIGLKFSHLREGKLRNQIRKFEPQNCQNVIKELSLRFKIGFLIKRKTCILIYYQPLKKHLFFVFET